MGKTFSTGLLTNAISTNGSNNVGIGGAADATVRLKVTGAATFSSSVTAGSNILINNSGTTIPNIGATSAQGGLNLYSGATADYNGGGLITLVSSDRSGAYTRGEVYISAGRATNNTANGFIALSTSDTERMRITSAGNVGIGTSTPEANSQLTLYGSSYSQFFMQNGTTGTGSNGFRILMDGNNLTMTNKEAGYLAFETSDTERMRILSNGNINFNGTVYDNTAVATTRTLYIGSDYRIGGISSVRASKKNIESISSVDWIYQLNPVTFNYRKKDEDEKYTDEVYDELVYGLIAEDTEPIADFLINYNDEKEMIGIEYSRLITPMLKAIQELKAEIDILKAK